MPRPRPDDLSQIPIIGHRDASFGPHLFQCHDTRPATSPSPSTITSMPASANDAGAGCVRSLRGPKSPNGLSPPVRTEISSTRSGRRITATARTYRMPCVSGAVIEADRGVGLLGGERRRGECGQQGSRSCSRARSLASVPVEDRGVHVAEPSRAWPTRHELQAAVFEYAGALYDRRRHSALGIRTPVEVEALWHDSVEEPGSAKTAPNQSVDEALTPGLCETQVEIHHSHQALLEQQRQGRLIPATRVRWNRGRSPCHTNRGSSTGSRAANAFRVSTSTQLCHPQPADAQAAQPT